MRRCFIYGMFLALASSSLAQKTSPWRSYETGDGLAESACLYVQPGSHDKIFVSHPAAQSISVLDGYTVQTLSLPANAEKRVFESPGGQLWAVVPSGLAEMTQDGRWLTHAETNIGAFKAQAGSASSVSLHPIRQGVVLFLLPDRLMEYDRDRSVGQPSQNRRAVSDTTLSKFLSLAPARDGGLWIIGSKGFSKVGGPVRSLTIDSPWTDYPLPEALTLEEKQSFHEDADGGFTVLARNGADQKKAALRFDGKIWTTLSAPEFDVRLVWRGSDQTDWAAGKGALYQLKSGRWQPVHSDEFNGLECSDVTVDATGAFWLTTTDGLYRHADSLWRTADSVPAFKETAPAGATVIGHLRDGHACIIAQNSLHIFDGKTVDNFPYPSPPPDPAGDWIKLYQAENGDLWLSSDHTVAWYRGGHWETFNSTDKSTPDGAVDFAEPSDGVIWCATRNKIWEFNGRTWISKRAGFDRIHCLWHSRSSGVWAGCNDGLYQFFHDVWTINGMEEGLPANTVRELFEDARGHLFAQTAGGVSVHHAEADRDPPSTQIQPLANKRIPEGGSITVGFGGSDKWRYAPAGRLLFSHRLDEKDWSEFESATNFFLSELAAGNHTLQVRAMDRNGNIDPHPPTLKFAVALSWYKETRLVLISAAGAGVAIFLGFVAYNRHRRLVLSHAEIEQKIAERTKELELAHRELLHSQKMNAMGALASGIAHDFNNILSIIQGSVQLIEENFHDEKTVLSRLDRIKTMVAQGSSVVKAMLGFARSDAPIGPQDLNELVADTVKLLGDRFLREVSIQLECDPNLPRITVSREFVQQILLNLVFNASEAVTEHKKIIIATRWSEELPNGLVLKAENSNPPVNGNNPARARHICLSVQDFGCGIPPEILPRIFEPFFTTKALSTRRGTGLGLSMVYNLAKKMGAGLAVQSLVGSGSLFTLVLPDSPETPTQLP